MAEEQHDKNDKTPGSQYIYTDQIEGGHIKFRKCAACGAREMRPNAAFVGEGLGGATEHGLNYTCPNCKTQVKIWDLGAFFMGSIYSLFWGAAGAWVFHQGPLWYMRHLSYFSNDYKLWYLPLDIGTILLSLAIVAFSSWIIWTYLLFPLKILLQHPVTGENRDKTRQERVDVSTNLRSALASFFLYSLLMWIPLIGVFWGLDIIGIDVQDNEFVKYTSIAVLLGLVVTAGKHLGVNVIYAFVGMVFWLAIFVAIIFMF